MKKTTERKRVARILKDSRLCYMNGHISAGSMDKIVKIMNPVYRKLGGKT